MSRSAFSVTAANVLVILADSDWNVLCKSVVK